MTGFTFVTTTTTQNNGGERKAVDWEGLNSHVIEMAKTQDKARSVPGIISGIIDLGEQNLDDAEQVFTGDANAEAAAIADKPATYFKDGFDDKGKPCRLKCWPQKPVQQMAVTIDFPQVMVDKGKFFGNSNPQPLRLLLNREFTLPGDKTKIVASPYNIRETKHDIGGGKTAWAFAKNNGLHKLADACGLLDTNGLFTKNRIGELLGKVAQFQFQVFMKPGKNGGSFFQEVVKLVGMVPEGVPLPEAPEGTLYGVNLYAANDPEAVKQLRVAIKNHIKRANNYEGSILKGELEALEGNRQSGEQQAPAEEKAKPQGVTPQSAPANSDDDFDDDVPF
ncbi:hypothetical protein 16Q_096 [Pseudomonas phage 16Q]|nr:hypothetical protein 16Q_096 [Pseudomonas phage 16Q]